MRGANKHEYVGRKSGIRMFVTISRVRSTEKSCMFRKVNEETTEWMTKKRK